MGKDLFLMILFLSVFLCWRGIHLLVTAASSGTIQSTGLSEPPIFFYFSAIFTLSIFYHTLREYALSDERELRNIRMRFNFLMFLFLFSVLLVVILVSEFVRNGALRITSCYGRVDEGIVNWPVTRIINLVYLCVLGILSLICGTTILVTGYNLSEKIFQLNVSESSKKTAMRYYLLGLLLSFCVFCLAGHLLIFGNIYSTRGIIWLRLSLLWVFELIIPLWLFSGITKKSENSTKSGDQRKGSSSHRSRGKPAINSI
eukprot:TRINITY_DN13473_c0_g1_i1.p1 TRINITY_DN13473_c0_g1~~TRINITY_DN13473_c0_g1_i1.p1  ORF type:complete len:278 (+),score=30.56 TRINITY_DN13473_c0_g1_i1:61-834(+)